MILGLSEKEQKLYDFIQMSERPTVKLIEEQLGKEYVGALGKLISQNLIESKKDRASSDSYAGKKMIKYYVIKKKTEIITDKLIAEPFENQNKKEE